MNKNQAALSHYNDKFCIKLLYYTREKHTGRIYSINNEMLNIPIGFDLNSINEYGYFINGIPEYVNRHLHSNEGYLSDYIVEIRVVRRDRIKDDMLAMSNSGSLLNPSC